MDCLDFGSDTGHSSRIGTANDGRGIYGVPFHRLSTGPRLYLTICGRARAGKLIDGGLKPTDLDICGGYHKSLIPTLPCPVYSCILASSR